MPSRSALATISALLVVASLALPGVAGGQEGRSGATIEVRGDQASYFPTSSEGDGVLVIKDVGTSAVFDHDRHDDVNTKVPTGGAMKLLGDEESVPAIVRRLDAPDDEDLYAVTLSQVTFDAEEGISAVAELDEKADRRLGEARADSGVPPVDLGAVELVTLDSNVRVGSDGAPRAPRSSATVRGNDYTFVNVTSNFPAGTAITFRATDGVCVGDQSTDFTWGQQSPPDTYTNLSFRVVSSGGGCWINPSVANWTVSIQPPGVDEWHRLWVYITVNQLSPISWNASCSTINQARRPSCQGGITFVGNTVSITMSPGA